MHRQYRIFVYIWMTPLAICSIQFQTFHQTSMELEDSSLPLFNFKSRSYIRCCILCHQHYLCIQVAFDKTTMLCTGYDVKQKPRSSSETQIKSYERSCQSAGFARLPNSSNCIKIIVDQSCSSWDEAYLICQKEGPFINLIDVTLEREFYTILHYIETTYVPAGILHTGTAVGIVRMSPDLPWKGITSGRVLDTNTPWGSVFENNDGLCLTLWMWDSLILDDIICNSSAGLGSLQTVICQEFE